MKGQDWNTITFAAAPKPANKAEAVKQAQRTGNVLAERKANHATTATGMNKRALEEETEQFKHKTTGTELRLAITQARAAKGLTQKQLAASLNMQPQVIQEYEKGTAIPNNAVIARIEKALGAKLPRAKK